MREHKGGSAQTLHRTVLVIITWTLYCTMASRLCEAEHFSEYWGTCTQVLSKSEVEWVNNYHKEVWEKASPRMSGELLEWLRENTARLEVPAQVAAMA